MLTSWLQLEPLFLNPSNYYRFYFPLPFNYVMTETTDTTEMNMILHLLRVPSMKELALPFLM
jgi:hypothetical protein